MNSTSMPSENKYSSATKAAVAAFLFALLLHASWIGAWLVEHYFEPRLDILGTSGGRSLYWFVMKLLLWVLPSIILIRASGMTLRGVMGFKRARSILIWGLGAGLILGSVALLSKRIGGQSVFTFTLGWPLFSGVIVAPIVEEFTFRGAILGAANRMKYWDLYIEFYQALNQRNEQGLPVLFAEELARTYAERAAPKKK